MKGGSMRALVTSALEVLGIGCICGGTAVIYWPAAVIEAGIALVALGVTQA